MRAQFTTRVFPGSEPSVNIIFVGLNNETITSIASNYTISIFVSTNSTTRGLISTVVVQSPNLVCPLCQKMILPFLTNDDIGSRVVFTFESPDQLIESTAVSVVVAPCAEGYEMSVAAGRCVQCGSQKYSLNGLKCEVCPLNANCPSGLEVFAAPNTWIKVVDGSQLQSFLVCVWQRLFSCEFQSFKSEFYVLIQ